MIQRKQTLFLLGSVIISILLIYIPVFELVSENANEPWKQFTISVNGLLPILNVSTGVLSLVAILLFKNRNLQVRLCNVALLITCVLVGLLFFLADSMISGMNQKIHYMYGS
jgi:hypothetical protein